MICFQNIGSISIIFKCYSKWWFVSPVFLVTALITVDLVFSSAARLVDVSRAEVALYLPSSPFCLPYDQRCITGELRGGMEGCFFFHCQTSSQNCFQPLCRACRPFLTSDSSRGPSLIINKMPFLVYELRIS